MGMRVAVVGSGFGLYGLLPAFSTAGGCEVAAICGERTERLLDGCRKAGVKGIYSDFREMLDTEKPDAVAIAVPPKAQHEIAEHALNAGMAVFAEKPLAASVGEAAGLCGLARKKKLPNMVDFIFPEIPEWAAAKKALDSGSIGKVLGVGVEWRFMSHDLKNGIRSWKTDVAQGGGALSFYFSHAFYYMEHFLGRIKAMECALSTSEKSLNGGETGVDIGLSFANGCTGRATLDSAHGGEPLHSIEFRGEKGTLRLRNSGSGFVDGFTLELIKGKGRKARIITPETSLGQVGDDAYDPRVKVVRSLARRFVGWCGGGAAAKPDFQDGLRVQELIGMARESAK